MPDGSLHVDNRVGIAEAVPLHNRLDLSESRRIDLDNRPLDTTVRWPSRHRRTVAPNFDRGVVVEVATIAVGHATLGTSNIFAIARVPDLVPECAARCLFNRLVALGAVRELAGQTTTRLYGLSVRDHGTASRKSRQ